MWVVLPKLTVCFEEKDYNEINIVIRNVFQLMFGLGLPCIVGTVFLSKEIILIVGGPDYGGAELYLALLMAALFFSLIGGSIIGNMILLPSKREKYFLFTCIVAAITHIVLNFIFIPKYGAIAAAISTIISHIIIFALLIPGIDIQIKFDFIPKTIFPPIIGCVFIFAVIFLTKMLFKGLIVTVGISVVFSILGYCIILYCFGYELARKVIERLKKRRKHNES